MNPAIALAIVNTNVLQRIKITIVLTIGNTIVCKDATLTTIAQTFDYTNVSQSNTNLTFVKASDISIVRNNILIQRLQSIIRKRTTKGDQ